jgi:hypothetical protein
MAETKEEIRQDRSKRIQQSKDTNNLIADNGLDGTVKDIYDILETSTDPVVIKLRMLREYGVTDEQIAHVYGDITGSVVNKEIAMESLAAVFKKIVLAINQQPNGIVIDLATGELNEKASYKQALSVGILDDTYTKSMKEFAQNDDLRKEIFKNLNEDIDRNEKSKIFERPIYIGDSDFFKDIKVNKKQKTPKVETPEDIAKKDARAKEKMYQYVDLNIEKLSSMKELSNIDLSTISDDERLEYAKILIAGLLDKENYNRRNQSLNLIHEMFIDLEDKDENGKIVDNSILANLLSKLTGKEILSTETIKMFEEMDNIVNQAKQKAVDDVVKEDEISSAVLAIESQLELSKGTPQYQMYLNKRNDFYNRNSEYREYAKSLRDQNGLLTQEGENQLYDYINTSRNNEIYEKIYDYKNFDNSKLSEEEKRQYAAYFLVGSIDIMDEMLVNESKELLKQMYPELDSPDDKKFLQNITDKIDPDHKDIETDKRIVDMRQTLNVFIIEAQNNELEKIADEDIEEFFNKEAVSLNVSNIDLTKSVLQNSFNDSQINFTDKNEQVFNNIYKHSTVDSWIESKEEALEHYYLSNLVLLDKLNDNPDLKISSASAIRTQVDRFKINYPEIVEKIDSKSNDELDALKENELKFEENRLNAKVLDFFSKEVLQPDASYSNKTDEKKRAYLRYVVIARYMADNAEDPEIKETLLKVANKGLENMNTDETKFIEFDENGNGIVNEENLVKEFKSRVNSRKANISDLESLKEFAFEKQNLLYSMSKFREYSELEPDEFTPLQSDNIDDKAREIEKIRFVKNKEHAMKRKQKELEKEERKERKNNLEKEFKAETKTDEKIQVEEIKVEEKEIEENSSDIVVRKENIFTKLRDKFFNAQNKLKNNSPNNNFFSKILNGLKSRRNFENKNNITNNTEISSKVIPNREAEWIVENVSGKAENFQTESRNNLISSKQSKNQEQEDDFEQGY